VIDDEAVNVTYDRRNYYTFVSAQLVCLLRPTYLPSANQSM